MQRPSAQNSSKREGVVFRMSRAAAKRMIGCRFCGEGVRCNALVNSSSLFFRSAHKNHFAGLSNMDAAHSLRANYGSKNKAVEQAPRPRFQSKDKPTILVAFPTRVSNLDSSGLVLQLSSLIDEPDPRRSRNGAARKAVSYLMSNF